MLLYLLLINIFILYIVAKKDSNEHMQGYTLGLFIIGSIIFWFGIGLINYYDFTRSN